MRLVVLGPSWHHLAEPFAGGQEAMVAHLVTGLRERGHQVLLYARAGTPADLADEVAPFPELPAMSALAHADADYDDRRLSDQHAYAWAVGDLASRPGIDLVLNHSFSHLPLSLGRLLPAPVLTTLHTPPIPWMEMGAALAPATARYVAVSTQTARAWTTLDEVTVVPNGVDAGRFAPGPGGPALVWVGRITPEKGLPVAIRAARRAGLPLSVIGPISDAAHFERDVRPLLGADVRYLGHLPQHAIRDVVATSAAALVTPRWDEPFGLVAAEAMMCGTPVVALDRGGLREVVGHGGGVVVSDPGTDDAAAEALAAAIPRAMMSVRDAVRADAVERLSATAMIDGYLTIIDDMLAPPAHLVEAPAGSSRPQRLRPVRAGVEPLAGPEFGGAPAVLATRVRTGRGSARAPR